jgi:hypothetical protein
MLEVTNSNHTVHPYPPNLPLSSLTRLECKHRFGRKRTHGFEPYDVRGCELREEVHERVATASDAPAPPQIYQSSGIPHATGRPRVTHAAARLARRTCPR